MSSMLRPYIKNGIFRRRYGARLRRARQCRWLHIKIFKRLKNQQRRPNEAFKKTQHAKPKSGGVADEIDPCADETQSIHCSGCAVAVNHFGSMMLFFNQVRFSSHFFSLLFSFDNIIYAVQPSGVTRRQRRINHTHPIKKWRESVPLKGPPDSLRLD